MHKIPDFTKASVLVIGDIILDRYWFGDTHRISPEAPVPIVNIQAQDERPGGAGNVALNIAALGANVRLLGVLGKDEAANILKSNLDNAHVIYDLIEVDNASTITKLRVMSKHQQLIRLDFEENKIQFDQTILLQRFKQHLASCNLVILSDYKKGTLECAAELIRMAREANVRVLVDPKGQNYSIYKYADIITPNLKEFELIAGQCSDPNQLLPKARKLLKDYQFKNLLLTQGEQGMTLIPEDSDPIHLNAHAKEVFDVTGAGDTVIAVLGASLSSGCDLIEATKLANLAAGISVSKLGAAAITAAELNHEVGSKPFAAIVEEHHLLKQLKELRLKGKKIVFTNGCFDILHAGHVTYLQQAKQLGDILIVAINQDHSLSQLKGPGRPINSAEHRKTVLAGLSMVDFVISFSEDTPKRLLKLIKPDILVKGGDYSISEVVGAEIVHEYGGEVRVLSVVNDISTSIIIKRILNINTRERVEAENASI